jgi:hypothetical protein
MEIDLMKELEEVKTELKLIKQLIEKNNQTLPIELQTLTAKQVMEIRHINKETLAKYRNSGEIKFRRYGNGTYVYPAKQFFYKD